MRTFLSNLLSLAVGNLFTLVVSFLLSIVMLQRLTAAEYGLQSAIVAFAGIAMSVADLGMYSIATREFARRPADQQPQLYCSLLSLQCVLSGSVFIGAAGVALALGSFPQEQFVIFVLGLFSMVASYAPIIPTEALMAARGRVRRIAIIQNFYALFATVFGILILTSIRQNENSLLLASLGIEHALTRITLDSRISLIYFALSGLSVFTIILYFREAHLLIEKPINLTYQPKEWWVYVRQGIPSGLGLALLQSCMRLGTYLIYSFVSHERAAYLGVCNLVLSALLSLTWVPYAVTILPVMTRLRVLSEDHWLWLVGRSVTILLAMTLPITVGTFLLAPDLLVILGSAQIVVAPTLRIFIFVLPLNITASFFYQMLLVLERPHLFLMASGAGALVNVIVCLGQLPRFGTEGAAFAAVLGLGVVVFTCLWIMRDKVLPQIRLADTLRLGAALTGLAIAVQATAGSGVILRIVAGALVYGILLMATGLFPAADRSTARTVLALGQGHLR